MIDVFTVVCYVILMVTALYGLFFGLIKVLTPIASGVFSLILMLALKNLVFGFLFQRAVFQGEQILSRVIVVIVVFVGLSIAFRCVLKALNLIAKLPILNGMNKLLGAVAGLLEGAMLVWLFMYFIYLFPTAPISVTCLQQLSSAPILTYLYEHNFVLFLFEMFVKI